MPFPPFLLKSSVYCCCVVLFLRLIPERQKQFFQMQFTLPVCLFSHKIPHKASSLPTYLSDRSRYSHVLLAWGCPRADVPLLQGMQQHLPGTHGQESIAWNTSCNSKDRMWLRVTPRQGGRAAAVQHWGLVVSSWFVVELWFRCLQPSSSSLVM